MVTSVNNANKNSMDEENLVGKFLPVSAELKKKLRQTLPTTPANSELTATKFLWTTQFTHSMTQKF